MTSLETSGDDGNSVGVEGILLFVCLLHLQSHEPGTLPPAPEELHGVISLPRHPQQTSGLPLASRDFAGVCMWKPEWRKGGEPASPPLRVVGESSDSGGAHSGSTAYLAV